MKTAFFGGLFLVFSSTYLDRVETMEHRQQQSHEINRPVPQEPDTHAEEIRQKIRARLNDI